MNAKVTSDPAWAIEIEDLTKSFGSRYALRDINLTIRKGDYLTIFGPNGAGKTTLIKILSTLSKPTSGTARLDGTDIRKDAIDIRRRLGVVSHSTFLYNSLTIAENLGFYGKLYGVSNLESRIKEVVAQVKLETRIHDQVGTLSRGMQQRVAIARAIIHNPAIMLLDEPETGLDPHATILMREILDSLNYGERTIVMTTHNLERGVELSDRIVILNRGQLVYEASRHEIDAATFSEVYDYYT